MKLRKLSAFGDPEQCPQVGASTERARKQIVTEAVKARVLLTKVLSEIRNPVLKSGLWSTTQLAAGVCSGTFEKVYAAKLAGRICGAPLRSVELAGLAAELFMFAALTLDDWIDHTQYRARKRAVHVSHGAMTAVLSSQCLTEAAHFALNEAAMSATVSSGNEMRRLFRFSVLSIQAGQANTSRLVGQHISSLGLLDRLAHQRCGYLMASAMSAAGYVSGRHELINGLSESGKWLGMALQHRNDIQDFTIAFRQTIKPPLGDLLNGQPNLVTAILFRKLPKMTRTEQGLLLHLNGLSLRNKKLCLAELNSLLDLCYRHNALTAASNHVRRCAERAWESIACFSKCEATNQYGEFLLLTSEP